MRASDSPGTGVIDSYELPWGCWNLNPCPWKEQQGLLDSEPSLQPGSDVFYPTPLLLAQFPSCPVMNELTESGRFACIFTLWFRKSRQTASSPEFPKWKHPLTERGFLAHILATSRLSLGPQDGHSSSRISLSVLAFLPSKFLKLKLPSLSKDRI